MVELRPVPFAVLITRMFQELERNGAIFDYPARRIVQAAPARDLSVSIHGHRASTPFGPAAGPHTQLAQNIVLAWLAGGRVMELKTVQIKDDLEIPRPCIDMQTIGFNVEWSQELSLKQSLEEYVKASMLIEMLKAEGLAPGFGDTVFDMSVGYDLAGIRSPKVRAFLDGMKDASEVVERLRGQIPAAFAHFRDLAFPTKLSDTLTLSTFHGCPPEEIESIGAFLLEEAGLHLVVKLNPTLLGRQDLNAILRDRLGYADLMVPDAAFAKDARWEQVVGIIERLGTLAERLGRGFGVKFSNTLLVRNHRHFFTGEKEMYLSGPPLHVLAISLVQKFRQTFGDRFPISFSAGIDAANFADAVALGLKPVSVCTDLLKVGGYGRAQRYFADLAARMEALGATDIDGFVLKAYGQAEPALASLGLPAEQMRKCRDALADGGDLAAAAGDAFSAWVGAARLKNTEIYAARVLADPRYRAAENSVPPKKIGSHLTLFDCLTCDKCIPLCPNDANFSLPIAPTRLPIEHLRRTDDGWTVETSGEVNLEKPRQIGTFADACNECGNCDVMCPEDGGPYLVKPLFFGSRQSWAEAPARDGFAFETRPEGLHMYGRFDGQTVTVVSGKGRVRYIGADFDLTLDPADPAGTTEGTANTPVDLTRLRLMELLRVAVTESGSVNYLSAGLNVA
ncbi:glutamate synthase [Telmatospirillum siberiense]|uniref:Glutamate synthase n=1 Tax=Telmatospirillum siberiense TaxID=382514 RepID=A0A2N3Q214_9PROT|nr:glutamate synthase [Telmatospirillum siberiense]PKU26641.1 glutamate synthase [Telmatospirillum siberiense]